MRTLLAIVILLSSFINIAAQTKTRGFQLVFGKYTFQTSTTISKDPIDKKSLRDYSYLFKNQYQVIKIPRRIRVIRFPNHSNSPKSRIKIDTIDQVTVSKIIDTISKSELTDIINSEIRIYDGKAKLAFDEAHLETVQPTGKTSFTIPLQKSKIGEGEHAYESLFALEKGGCFILHRIWFYDLKHNRHEIECNIAWIIE